MRVVPSFLVLLAAAAAFAQAPQTAQTPPQILVREVVYNELHDHQRHGYWRYWIAQQAEHQSRLSQQVETADGPITRLVSTGGHPLSANAAQQEDEKLHRVAASPAEQARRRQAYADDERRIGRILSLLPEAFLFENAGEENGLRRMRFRPNPAYPAHSMEARIFHAMTGEIAIDTRMKRLARLEGHLEENVDFGYGLLGRLYQGGWFLMERSAVSDTDWKTVRLEIHMNGRALLFKTIARETSERRGGFESVPAGLSMAQGIALLDAPPTQAAAQTHTALGTPLQATALSVRH
jgi:hypothetical protein